MGLHNITIRLNDKADCDIVVLINTGVHSHVYFILFMIFTVLPSDKKSTVFKTTFTVFKTTCRVIHKTER